jgi:hypothetical protein
MRYLLAFCLYLLLVAASSAQTLVVRNNLYPASSVPISTSSSGSTGAVTVTLPNQPLYTTFICGFDVSAIGGTAPVGPITVSGLVSGTTFTYQMSSSPAGNTFSRDYDPCIPANDNQTAIVIKTTANPTATAVSVNAWGMQLYSPEGGGAPPSGGGGTPGVCAGVIDLSVGCALPMLGVM